MEALRDSAVQRASQHVDIVSSVKEVCWCRSGAARAMDLAVLYSCVNHHVALGQLAQLLY